MNVLEQRYRRVLRMLPTSYRQAWEEDMVATFLASMDTDDVEDAEFLADYGRPSWSEVASVATLAVRLRVGGAGMPPLSVVWGETVRAVRLVALAVLLFSAVVGTWGVRRNPWLANEIPWFPAPAAVPAVPWGFWDTMREVVVGLPWVAAYLSLVFGRWRPARLFAVLAFAPIVGFAVRDTLAEGPVFARWSDVSVTALLLLTLAVFHRDTPTGATAALADRLCGRSRPHPRRRTRDLDAAHGQQMVAGLAGTELCPDPGRGPGLPGRSGPRAQPRTLLGTRPRPARLGHVYRASRITVGDHRFPHREFCGDGPWRHANRGSPAGGAPAGRFRCPRPTTTPNLNSATAEH